MTAHSCSLCPVLPLSQVEVLYPPSPLHSFPVLKPDAGEDQEMRWKKVLTTKKTVLKRTRGVLPRQLSLPLHHTWHKVRVEEGWR